MESRFVPGYAAPAGGLTAWAQPDAAILPAAHIEARVEVQLIERVGDWAHIECNNGWRAWVDARLLAPLTVAPGAQFRPRSALNPAITTIGRYTVTLADLVPAAGVVLGALLPWLRGSVALSNTARHYLSLTTARLGCLAVRSWRSASSADPAMGSNSGFRSGRQGSSTTRHEFAAGCRF